MATTPSTVRSITGSELIDSSIVIFIDTAEIIVGDLTYYTASMTTAKIDLGTAYLAAHLLVSSGVGKDSATITKESIRGKYTVEYLSAKISGTGILSTQYGQTANTIFGGSLAELDKTPVRFVSVGSL